MYFKVLLLSFHFFLRYFMEVIQTRIVIRSVIILLVELAVLEHRVVMAEDVEMLTTYATVIVILIMIAKQPN